MRRQLRLIFLLGSVLLAVYWGYRYERPQHDLAAKLSSIVAVRQSEIVNCTTYARQRPLVLLVLGQSNAGNHGDLPMSDNEPVAMQVGSDCVLANGPLPGATGNGGSIWRHLPSLLSKDLAGRKVLLSVLAVDSTTIDDWTRPGSVLAERLIWQIQALRRSGLKPDFVLWQQGEADAHIQTSTSQYLRGLERLVMLLDRAGTNAPLLLARSTVCRSPPNAAIRSAVDQAARTSPRFLSGPDTDLLLGDADRLDGCHLTASGLKHAAQAWAEKLKILVVSR